MQKYEQWAPVVARVIFGAVFLFGASAKIPGTAMFAGEVMQTAAVGVPLAYLAVLLAGVLELVGGLMLILGYRTRLAAFIFIPYIALLTVLFHIPTADPVSIGFFIDHWIFMAGLLYVSVYGARHCALKRD